MNGWSISSFTLAILSHWIDGEPAGVNEKFDANLLKMLPECLPELPAQANVVIVVAPCRCAASATCCTSVLNQTPVGSKRKKKRKSTHQWPSVTEHHLVHTIRTQDESIQKKKKTSHMFGTHKNVPARANPVCAVHRPCLRKDRKRAGMSRSGTSRATQHGWSSLAASGPPSWGAKKKCRLSVTQVWLFWWNGGARTICQKRIMSIQMFRRPFKSARCFTISPIPRHATPSSGIWEECLHSIK